MEMIVKLLEVVPAPREHMGKFLTSHQYWENSVTNEKKEGIMFGLPGWTPVTEDYFFGNPRTAKIGLPYGKMTLPVGEFEELPLDLRAHLGAVKTQQDIDSFPNMKITIESKTDDPRKLCGVKFVEFTEEEATSYTDIFN